MKIGIVGKSRYIDVDELIKSIDKEIFTNPTTRSYFKQIVRKQSTADVVEVVRCKDCDFSVGDGEKLPLNCIHANGLYMPKLDGFCSFGVRKGGEG